MPDKMIALLLRILEQGNGHLSRRAKEKEFQMLKEDEIKQIETIYNEVFNWYPQKINQVKSEK